MSSIRALTAELAARSDNALRTLFDARPDLIYPPVPDFAALAARACARASVARALDRLDQPQAQVLEVLHLTTNEDLGQSATAATLKPLIEGSTLGALEGILKHLHAMALLYRAPAGTTGTPGPAGAAGTPVQAKSRGYLPVSSLKDVIGLHPAGLGRSYVDLVRSQASAGARLLQSVRALHRAGAGVRDASTPMEAALAMHAWLGKTGSLELLLKTAPENTDTILARFSAGPVGAIPKALRPARMERPDASPVDWLLARGLLIPLDGEHVELPSDVALVLRGHVFIRGFSTSAPIPALKTISAARRSNAALGSIAEVLRLVTELLAQVRDQPLATLRAGGVGVREVRRLADSLRIDPERATLLLELAALSGLLMLDVDTSHWQLSDRGWMQRPREEQWLWLATSWLHSDRAPSLVGQPIPRRAGAPGASGAVSAAAAAGAVSAGVTGGGTAGSASAGPGTINALAAEAHRPDAPVLRQQTLAIMAELADEAQPQTGDGGVPVLDADSIAQRFHWRQPRLARRLRRLLPGFLAEAELLGLTGSGSLTRVGAALARGESEEALELLRTSLPPALAHVLLQADLTAVAPGYLSPELSTELNLLAEAEGQGPATTYRFSTASIRRALDAGQDAERILDFLGRHSATEIPQPLRYLVEDTAARHGRLRVGGAASYLQSDDDAILAELLETPSLEHLGLQALAPTVLVSRAGPREVALALRELGLAPALADTDEAVVRVGRPAAAPARQALARQAPAAHPART
ncbi:MAG: helicase-associated domain-containing protein, partial [Actinomycetota bacterium]|nr:helicase-associated domain-containing protein [Actinomycetota bacterium]